MAEKEPIGVIGVGLGGPGHRAPASPSSATRSGRATSCPRRSSRSGAATCRSTSPASSELVQQNAERLHFTHRDGRRAGERRSCCSAAWTRRPPTRATPTSRAWSACRRARRLDRPRARHEEHRAGGHRPLDPPPPRGTRLRVQPRVPQGGQRGRRLHAARPRGDRRRRGLRGLRRPRGRPVRAARARRWSRTDVASAEMVKLASNAFLATKISLHQRDRQRVGGARRGRERGGARHGTRRAHRPEVSCRRASATAAPAWPARRPCWSAATGAPRCSRSSGSGSCSRRRATTAALGLIEPAGLEVLSWVPGDDEPRFMPVSGRDATRGDGRGCGGADEDGPPECAAPRTIRSWRSGKPDGDCASAR